MESEVLVERIVPFDFKGQSDEVRAIPDPDRQVWRVEVYTGEKCVMDGWRVAFNTAHVESEPGIDVLARLMLDVRQVYERNHTA